MTIMTMKEFVRILQRNKHTYSPNDLGIIQDMIDNEFDIEDAQSLIEVNVHIGDVQNRTHYVKKANHIVMDDIRCILSIKYRKTVEDMKKLQEKKMKIARQMKVMRGK